jgi:membrane protease YdiL (CAAX protease family)
MPSFIDRIRAVIWSIVSASLINIFGAGVWTALITSNLITSPTIPWAIPVLAFVLWLMRQYLGGKGWPRWTAEARHLYLRANRVPRVVWVWALLASLLSIIALAGFWIVLVELVGAGGNPTIPDYTRYPRLIVVLGLLMSPLTEEAAFRGYARVRLEQLFPAGTAIAIASLLFALWHGPTQGFCGRNCFSTLSWVWHLGLQPT